MPKKAEQKPLTPPDRKQCQADVPTGHSFMTLGGSPGKRVRCTNKPTVIVAETVPGSDGRKGSMSLCDSCLKVFKETIGEGAHKFTPIKRTKAKTKRTDWREGFLKVTGHHETSEPKRKPKREHHSERTRIDGSTRLGE